MRQVRNAMMMIGAIFAAIGLFFVVFGVWQYSVCNRLMTEGVSVQAAAQWRGSDDLWISFEAEGKLWEVESIFHSDSIRSGDEITVWYMKDDPSTARITDWWTYAIFLIIGGIFALMGLAFVGWQARIAGLRRTLEETGQRIWADVTAVKQLRSVRINGRNPYVIYADGTHPYTGSKITFKSRMILNDPRPYLTSGKIEVLVDRMEEKRYHVLIDALEGDGTPVRIEQDAD